MKERLGGELCILNLAVRGVSSVLMNLSGRMRWVYGRISGGVGDFSRHTRFEVGNSSKIRLRHDRWCGDKELKETFLDLYSIVYIRMLL